MPVIARDAVASDHLVYAWPFPIGPDEYEVSCADDEQVVMCPSWLVGERLGPGRHRWRSPNPMQPVAAYFVLTAPVEVSFDVYTQFIVPATGQPVRLRASGSLQVRCSDPGLLIAQFVGLPFDHVNDGILRSVSRSIERMVARLLTRRVVLASSPFAVTDPQMLGGIVEELVAYNPAAGAVFGVELVRMGRLSIHADDGSQPWSIVPNADWSPQPTGNGVHQRAGSPPPASHSTPTQVQQAQRAQPATIPPPMAAQRPSTPPVGVVTSSTTSVASGELGGGKSARAETQPIEAHELIEHDEPSVVQQVDQFQHVQSVQPVQPVQKATPLGVPVAPVVPPTAAKPAGLGRDSKPQLKQTLPMGPLTPIVPRNTTRPPTAPTTSSTVSETSGEIQVRAQGTPSPVPAPAAVPAPAPVAAPKPVTPVPAPAAAAAIPSITNKPRSVEVQSPDEITQPGAQQPGAQQPGGQVLRTPVPGTLRAETTPGQEARGSIIGIGMSHIGAGTMASGEIQKKHAPGSRVLVPGPNGLMQSATVRQLLQGYYELEVGGSGETIWVPMNGVVSE